MSLRLKNLKKFKQILDTIIDTLEDDDTQTSDIIEYVCKSVDSFYEEIKNIINKKKQIKVKEEQNKEEVNSLFDISKINIYKSENKHIQNLNNFTNNIYYY
jgi:hypothetical protein